MYRLVKFTGLPRRGREAEKERSREAEKERETEKEKESERERRERKMLRCILRGASLSLRFMDASACCVLDHGKTFPFEGNGR